MVDDEAEIRSLLGAVLQAKGFEVVTAADGAAALEQVQRERPSVILMDLSMPRMNGMDALPEIKRLDPEVPVIICTAHADLATAVRAMKLGAYDYLTKPFDLEFLDLTLERAVERNQLRSRIDMKRAAPARPAGPAGGDTVAIVAADAQGNAVSMIQSLYFTWGSGLVAGDTGVVLQNRGAFFSLDPKRANALAPSTRVISATVRWPSINPKSFASSSSMRKKVPLRRSRSM